MIRLMRAALEKSSKICSSVVKNDRFPTYTVEERDSWSCWSSYDSGDRESRYEEYESRFEQTCVTGKRRWKPSVLFHFSLWFEFVFCWALVGFHVLTCAILTEERMVGSCEVGE
jgi:hypothetical protein